LQGIDSEVISIILHAVPFTGAFMIPGSMLLGNVSLLVGIGYLALLIVFTVAVALYSGKLYKNQLFYNNVKGSFLKKLLK